MADCINCGEKITRMKDVYEVSDNGFRCIYCAKPRIVCLCGKIIAPSSYYRHKETKKHRHLVFERLLNNEIINI